MKKIILILVVMFVFTTCVFGEGWEVRNYVDDFGDYTNERYVMTSSWGTFSNSATYGSKLYFIINVDTDIIVVRLFEYGIYPFNNYNNRMSKINVKFDDSSIESVKIFVAKDCIFIREDYDKFIRLLKEKNKLKIYFENDRSRYNFEINCMGFTKQYNSLIKDKQ